MFKLYYVRIEQMEENFSEIEFLEGKFEQIDESNEKIGSSYKDDNGKDTEENLLSSNDIAEQTDRSNKKINSYEDDNGKDTEENLLSFKDIWSRNDYTLHITC